MLSEKMDVELNRQINAEMFSSYLYLSMSGWLESKGLTGFAIWMRAQAKEETFHAEKIYTYVHERGGRVILEAIDKPESEWDSPLHIFREALKHEEMISGMINDLVDLAIKEKDHASNNFLQWFIAEQVEEEANVGNVVDRLALIGDDSAGLFALDMEMAKRTFTEEEA
ncbi:ferritin [Desulfopila inferna]|uniref:ferritin n=1 Tax=Desulfopila inferna TaxID=468528 RepID=UPI00196604EA|nr:ferritin [Desulfopila inferna]MBM9603239.1 ferritin [Desulfopila inferna]